MSLICLLPILFAIIMQHSTSTVIKSQNLTASDTNTAINGAKISESYADGDVSVSNDNWDIFVYPDSDSQRGFHLQIELDQTWGFHTTKPSTIALTIYSNTTLDTNTDLDLIISFSINAGNYITHWLAVDNQIENTIYPACDTKSAPTQSMACCDIKTCCEQEYCWLNTQQYNSREEKVSGGNTLITNSVIQPNNLNETKLNAWPITVTLTNDPNKNAVFTNVYNPSWNGWHQGCGYSPAFTTYQGLQIYIALDDNYERIVFDKFKIEYSYDTDTTSTSTSTPTNNPNPSPTQIPTYNPTVSPTKNPTQEAMTYTTINGIWQNNHIGAPPEGWTVIIGDNIIDYKYVTGFGTKYDGPFTSITDGVDTYYLSQRFYCAQTSSVVVRYTMLYCNTEIGDYIELYLNGESEGIQQATNGFGSIAHTALYSACSQSWSQKTQKISERSLVREGILFNVTFKINIDGNNEAITMTDMEIECIPKTSAPITARPTSSTISPTKLPTKLPTTAQPTNAPTKQPSKHPTMNPTKQPTTSEPTGFPTKVPTDDPSKHPTNNPSKQPTNGGGLSNITPTTSPSDNAPTAAPNTNNPTRNIADLLVTLPQKDKEGEHIEDKQTTSESVGDDKEESKNKNALISMVDDPMMLYYIIGGAVLLCCICCVLIFIIKRKKRKNAIHNGQKMGYSIQDLSPSTTMTDKKKYNGDKMRRIHSVSNTNTLNRFPSTSSHIMAHHSNTNEISTNNLSSSVGVNNILMDDIVNDINIVASGGTLGGPDNILNGDKVPPPSNSNGQQIVAIPSDYDIEMAPIITPNGDDTETENDGDITDETNEDNTDEMERCETPNGDNTDEDNGDIVNNIVTPNDDNQDVILTKGDIDDIDEEHNNPNLMMDEFIIDDTESTKGNQVKIEYKEEGKDKENITPQ